MVKAIPFVPAIGEAVVAGGAALWAAATSTTSAVVISGAATGAAVGIAANQYAKSQAQSTLTTANPGNPCPSCCGELRKQIYDQVEELKQRFEDMRVDSEGLFSDPSRVFFRADGSKIGSWDGHVKQFQDKQKRLKKMLKQHLDDDCGDAPGGAESWANTKPPSSPRQ